MTSFHKLLEKSWKDLTTGSVLYFSATDPNLLRAAEKEVLARWERQGEPVATRLDGPMPDMGELIAATGAISLFGGSRHVLLRELGPSSLSDKDVQELEALFGDLENAVLLVTTLHKDRRAAASKKAKALFAAAQKNGLALELTPPSRQENISYLRQKAEECGGAQFAAAAAEELLDRAGADRVLLENETEKLAAISGYGVIDVHMVQKYGASNMEADVFELAKMITMGRRGPAQEKLLNLLSLRHEPVAITAALGGSFVDMFRVRAGAESRHDPAEVFREMGYKGSEYRLVKAKENAAKYSTPALEEGILALAKLDMDLKSSPLADKSILLQAAVEDLIRLRENR